jgi:hypothetical protein
MSAAAIVFDQSIKDAQELLARFDEENSGSATHNPETLKRAGLVMAMAAWETYVKDRITEEIEVWLRSVDGSPIGKFVRRQLNEDLKRFFNPNTDKTKHLFIKYFEVDITQGWNWDNYGPSHSKTALDTIVSKRGDAAHQTGKSVSSIKSPDLVKRDELEKAIRFLKGLVVATDKVKLAK